MPALQVLPDRDFAEVGKRFIAADLIPLLLPDGVYSRDVLQGEKWMANRLFDADNGLFDNLPYKWANNLFEKRDIRNELMGRQYKSKGNAFLGLQACLLDRWQGKISALILEPEDTPAKNTITLGGSAIVSRDLDTWDSASVSRALKEPSGDGVHFAACSLAELAAASMCLSLPIYLPERLYESLTIDATIVDKQGETLVEARISSVSANRRALLDDSETSLPLAWEIFNPRDFLRFSTIEKRMILRKSGVRSVPRPREGRQEVDALLLDLMDEAVRGEVLRLLASGADDCSSRDDIMDMYGEDEEEGMRSGRQALLERMGEALMRGDEENARQLREEFVQKTLLRADPTQAEGAYSRFLDQDEWYLQERKRAMGQ
eukprot:gene34258-41468_t